MPDYRYTEVIYCNNCEYISSRDPQFRGFKDTIDPDIITKECEECGEVDWDSRHEQDDAYRDRRRW